MFELCTLDFIYESNYDQNEFNKRKLFAKATWIWSLINMHECISSPNNRML